MLNKSPLFKMMLGPYLTYGYCYLKVATQNYLISIFAMYIRIELGFAFLDSSPVNITFFMGTHIKKKTRVVWKGNS